MWRMLPGSVQAWADCGQSCHRLESYIELGLRLIVKLRMSQTMTMDDLQFNNFFRGTYKMCSKCIVNV